MASSTAGNLGATVIFLMMMVVTVAVVSRALGSPIVGDVEIVQLLMVVVIMMALGGVESEKGHVSIGLIVDRFPPRVQALLDVLAVVLTVLVTFTVSLVHFRVAWTYLTERPFSSDLLSIPLYPFKIIIAIGFLLWGLEALNHLPKALQALRTGELQPGVGGSRHAG